MKFFRHREKVTDEVKLRLPKGFEFKLLGKVIEDLEQTMLETEFRSDIAESLSKDFKLARSIVRSRNSELAARMSNLMITQSTILGKPLHYGGDALAFYLQYQLGALLKKYPFKGEDTEKKAYQSFGKAEISCARFNSEGYKAVDRLNETLHPLYGGILQELREDIERLIGPSPDLHSVEVDACHGPGTSLSDSYTMGRSTNYYKWANLPYTVTEAAVPLAKRAIANDPRWIGALMHWYRTRCKPSTVPDHYCHRDTSMFVPIDMEDFWSRILKVVDGSRITTVPKSALTDRTIAIEPVLNVYLQLGVDAIFKRRLKSRWGYDLTKQDVNQDLAFEGSKNGTYATIDLKAASDTISLKVCEMLLPAAWFDLLLTLRSPKGALLGRVASFSKISSMGNGFTFALESLIFGALTRAAMRRTGTTGNSAVYGDDIIVPTPAVRALGTLLNLFGFELNADKSFASGPFRESCGADWFLGYNVRPLFLKKPIRTVMDLFYVHNRLCQIEEELEWAWGIHFRHTRRFLRKYIPKKFGRCYGPPGESLDTYLFSQKPLQRVGQAAIGFAIIPKARRFNRKTSFLFRKMMVALKGVNLSYENRWDKRKRLTTGNSFDVTRRDRVYYMCTKLRHW